MRGYVNIDIGQVHYRRTEPAGVGRPLLIIHESPLASVIFQPVLDELERIGGLDVVAVDLPGYGMSDPPEGQPTVGDYARWMLAAASELGFSSFTLAGSHGASAISLEMALQAPERIDRLILSGIPLIDVAEQKDFLENVWTLHSVEPDMDGSHLMKVWEHYRTWWGAEAGPDLLHLASTIVLSNHTRYMSMLRASLSYDAIAALSKVEVPIVLFTPKRDPLAKATERAESLRPDIVETIEGPDVGGQLWWRARDAFVDVLARCAVPASA